jgi:hypothetical protein
VKTEESRIHRETGHAGGRPGQRSSPINEPDAELFSGTVPIFTKKEKSSKKERKGRPVETAAAVEIEQGSLRRYLLDDFHRCLEKPPQKTLRLFHSYHRPDGS